MPEDASDSGHYGCCGPGCVDGVEVGACCCDHLWRSEPCLPGKCWLEVDFGASVTVECMAYSSVHGLGDIEAGLMLQVWSVHEGRWNDLEVFL